MSLHRPIYTIFLGLLVLFSSSKCKRSGSGYVEGNVTLHNTNEPLVDVPVRIYRSFQYNQAAPYFETKTSSTGYYKVKYFNKLHPGYTYQLRVSPENCYLHNPYEGNKDISVKKERFDFSFNSLAFMRFRVKNTRPNSLTLMINNDKKTPDLITLIVPKNSDSLYIDNLQICGSCSTSLHWTCQDNNSTLFWTHDSTIAAPGNGTTLIYPLEFN